MLEKVVIIDSGIGGLTIFQRLLAVNKGLSVTYVADNKFFPYGVKDDNQLITIIDRMLQYFIKLDYKAIILACNTASHIFTKYLKHKYNDRVISIIESTINDLSKISKCNQVGLIATHNTILSNIYQTEILKRLKVSLYPLAASELVDLCEELNIEGIKEYIQHYFQVFKDNNIDTLILACTHFNAIVPFLNDFFHKRVQLVCSGYSALEAFDTIHTSDVTHTIYLTDYRGDYVNKIKKYLKELKNFKIKELNL